MKDKIEFIQVITFIVEHPELLDFAADKIKAKDEKAMLSFYNLCRGLMYLARSRPAAEA